MNQDNFSPEMHKNSVIFDYKLINLQGYEHLLVKSYHFSIRLHCCWVWFCNIEMKKNQRSPDKPALQRHLSSERFFKATICGALETACTIVFTENGSSEYQTTSFPRWCSWLRRCACQFMSLEQMTNQPAVLLTNALHEFTLVKLVPWWWVGEFSPRWHTTNMMVARVV